MDGHGHISIGLSALAAQCYTQHSPAKRALAALAVLDTLSPTRPALPGNRRQAKGRLYRDGLGVNVSRHSLMGQDRFGESATETESNERDAAEKLSGGLSWLAA